MKEPRHDDERLAALLEGRLEGPERDELLAYLATADEDFHVFAKTAAVLREMEEEEAAQARQAGEQVTQVPARETLPPSLTGKRRRWGASRVIVPAVLAGLVVFGIFTTRGRAANLGDPMVLAASLDRPLPADWAGNWPWEGTRGDAERNAAQAGAMMVDLALAVRTRDIGNVQGLARSIRTRFDNQVPSIVPLLQEIEQRAAEGPDVLRPKLAEVTKRLAGRVDRDYLQLGAWTEAARLAARDHDAEFFRSSPTPAMLDLAERLTQGNEPAQGTVREIRAAIGTDGEPGWTVLAPRLDALMMAVAS